MELWHRILETLQYYAYYIEFLDLVGIYITTFTLLRVKGNKLLTIGTRRCLQHSCGVLFVIFVLDLYWAGCSYFPRTWLTGDNAIYLASGIIYALVPWVVMGFIMRYQRGKTLRLVLIYTPLLIYECICIYNLIHPSFFRMVDESIVRNDLYYVTSIMELYSITILGVYGIDKTFVMSRQNRLHIAFALNIVVAGVFGDILYQQIAFMWTSLALCMLFLLQVFSNVYMEKDPVTGLWNRTMYEIMLREYGRKKHLTYAAFDLNNLKYLNDHFGHQAGDAYLRNAADVLVNCVGSLGGLYRIGGDEFAFVSDKEIPDLENKLQVLEGMDVLETDASLGQDMNVLDASGGLDASGALNASGALDVSGVLDASGAGSRLSFRIASGVAHRKAGESLENLISRADHLMYEQKARMKAES